MSNRTLVALLRGIILSVALFAIQAAIGALGGELPPALDQYAMWIPLVITLLRTAEGVVDQLKKGDEPATRNVIGL